MNSNRETGLFFKNLYLSAYFSDLSDLWLVGKILKRYTSFMLNIESDLIVFRDEFLVE